MIRLIVLTLLICISTMCVQNHSMNRNNLDKETSPYLIQHQANPVHWQRWNQNLYQNQNPDDKLLIVSIGYSSCHWCHVMEKETFADQDVAKTMNADYINIKVDREENPDVDHIYITAVQLMTGSGGWPLNVIILPDGRPIYGGTYHTKEQWIQVLEQIQDVYQKDKSRLIEVANHLEQGLKEYNLVNISDQSFEFSKDSLEKGIENWKIGWDDQYGGDKVSQKFIIPNRYQFLMQYQKRLNHPEVDRYILNSLEKIANSGVFDPIEGGFYRYSVDPFWEVPHFEKMLYDNAQILGLYANAYKKYKKPLFKNRIYQIFEFMESRLLDTTGAYYAAIDADNEQGEGRYYVWSKAELEQLIDRDWDLFVSFYGVDFNKPFEDEFYILRQSYSIEEFSQSHNLSLGQLKSKIEYWKNQLKSQLAKRDFPGIDDKLLASWNALAIVGLSQSYQATGDPIFLDKAMMIYDFIEKQMIHHEQLYHTFQNGRVKIEGFLEDYAHFIESALTLYKMTGDTNYLDSAQNGTNTVLSDFSIDNTPYFSFKKENPLITQIISTEDNVIASPNSVMASNLFELGQLLQNQDYIERAKKMILGMQSQIIDYASSYSHWASLYTMMTYGFYEVIINGKESNELSKELLSHYLPQIIFQQSDTASDLPLLKDRFDNQQTYIYVCQNRVCLLPVTTVDEALTQLENFSDSSTVLPKFY